MTIADYVSLSILVLLLGAHIFVRPLLVRHPRALFLLSGLAMGAALLTQTREQFSAWQQAAPPANFLIPPYTSITYFIKYAWTHFWLPYLLAAVVGLIALLLINRIPKQRREQIFESDELALIVLSLFLVGHPGWLIYGLISLLAYLSWSLLVSARAQRSVRVSFYHFWIPLALTVKIAAPFIFPLLPFLTRLSTG